MNSSLINQIMATELICMNISGQNMLLELFPHTNIDEEKRTMSFTKYGKTIPLYGEPCILANRGANRDEVHALMLWAEHNAAPFGKVVGVIDPETGDASIFDKNFLTEHGIDKSPCPKPKSPVVEPEKVVAPAAE